MAAAGKVAFATEVTSIAWPIIARFAFLLRHTSRPPTERPMARTRNIGTPTLTPMIHELSDAPTDSPRGLEVELGGGGGDGGGGGSGGLGGLWLCGHVVSIRHNVDVDVQHLNSTPLQVVDDPAEGQ